jgi:hypothetical protein
LDDNPVMDPSRSTPVWRLTLFLAPVLAVALGAVRLAQAEVGPPDVYARVSQVQAEVELIRVFLGAPAVEPLGLRVTGAAPREVHFQATTLFTKADQLSFERARQRGSAPRVESSGSPADVLAVVDAAMRRITVVKQHHGIMASSAPPVRDPSRTPTDVFLLLVDTNRQLNQVLRRPFEPGDVFAQVTLAMGYSARLLSKYEGAVRLPRAPAHEADKIPGDVFRRLGDCYAEAAGLATSLGHAPLTLDLTGVDHSRIAPSDAYDIASLVLSELAFLHGQVGGLALPLGRYDPGPKDPSDVFQRVGILRAQLQQLGQLVAESPRQLGPGGAQ